MSLRIKIPKRETPQAELSSQVEGMSLRSRTSKKRIAPDSEFEDDFIDDGAISGSGDEYLAPAAKRSKSKRARTVESTEDVEVDVDVEPEKPAAEIEDTRFLPDKGASLSRGSSRRSSSGAATRQRPSKVAGPSQKRSSKKRTVILSDEEEEFDVEAVAVDEDDNFEPEGQLRRGTTTIHKGKGRGIVATKGAKGKSSKGQVEKAITFRDERKVAPPIPSSSKEEPVKQKEPTPPPPPKKPKLPPIKKIRSSAGSGPSTPAVRPPLTKAPSIPEKSESNGLPLPPIRKPAGAAAASDFDLRDKSVYAQLFAKPGGIMPNSGLNRKEKEEERRKELNRMRDDARKKRQEEAKQSFDLQSAAEKISRFEDKLRSRKSMALFPNILGATFKDAFERNQRTMEMARRLYGPGPGPGP